VARSERDASLQWGCNEQASPPDAPSASRPTGVAFLLAPKAFGVARSVEMAGISTLLSRLGQRQKEQQRDPLQYFNSLLGRRRRMDWGREKRSGSGARTGWPLHYHTKSPDSAIHQNPRKPQAALRLGTAPLRRRPGANSDPAMMEHRPPASTGQKGAEIGRYNDKSVRSGIRTQEAGAPARGVAGSGVAGLTGANGGVFGLIWRSASSAVLRVTRAKIPWSIPAASV
jgi:hypothetical protein